MKNLKKILSFAFIIIAISFGIGFVLRYKYLTNQEAEKFIDEKFVNKKINGHISAIVKHKVDKVVRLVKNDSIFHITIQNRVREKNHYNGKLYILIDGGCFSATAYTAAFLKKHKRGLFIGEETGGGEKGCNAMVMNYLELPNTKLRYRFPFFRVEHNVTPQAIGRGVFPDVNIKYDKKSRLEDKDLEMEKVRMVVENIFVPTGI